MNTTAPEGTTECTNSYPIILPIHTRSLDSSVGRDHRFDDRKIGIQFQDEEKFPPLTSVQTRPVTHPVAYLMGTGGKMAGA
jgi:hypothetical protein